MWKQLNILCNIHGSLFSQTHETYNRTEKNPYKLNENFQYMLSARLLNQSNFISRASMESLASAYKSLTSKMTAL